MKQNGLKASVQRKIQQAFSNNKGVMSFKGPDSIENAKTSYIQDFAEEFEKFVNLIKENSFTFNNTGVLKELNSIVTHTIELFNRMENKDDDSRKYLALVHYEGVFRNLNIALSEDYYLDIVKRPSFWNNSKRRFDEVYKAVLAVDSELIQNIRNVNSSTALEMEISLTALVNSISGMNNHKEIYNP